MNELKACLFDLDGVIVDTAKYHFLAWKELANRLDIPFNEKDNERLKGVSRMRSLEIILEIGKKELPIDEQEEIAAGKNEFYLQYVNKMTKDDILPGVKELLIELRQKHIKVGLGSASKNAVLILNQLEIKDLFDTIIDGTTISEAKPKPEVFLKGAEALSVQADNCVVFEDAVAGVQAAKNAGMYCIGIGEKETLTDADEVVPGFTGFNLGSLKQMLANQ